jgi:tRNA uridine 5-carboxymethylaminomethyl modification enzyme
VTGRPPLYLGRETSYIGVLIDDLVHRGVDEPYRLFTSRSEFRLTVRQDNALRRLAPIAQELGLLSPPERAKVARRLDDEDSALRLATERSIVPAQVNGHLATLGSSAIPHSMKIVELARRQDVQLRDLFALAGVGADLALDAVVTAELQIKYAGYFERERVQADKMRRMGHFSLELDLPYESMQSISFEARQKFAAQRPRTLAQASRIPGVSPNDLQNLVLEVERHRRVAGAAGGAS